MKRTLRIQHAVLALTALLLFVAGGPARFWWVSGDEQLLNRSVELSDSRPGTTSTHQFTFDIKDTPILGSIRFQFCSNSPLIGQLCDAPVGFDDTPAILTAQAGNVGFTISNTSTPNELIINRSPAAAAAITTLYTFAGIQNPTSNGSYYVRVQMFTGQEMTGTQVEYGGLAYSINEGIGVNATVPPYLLFCTGITIQPYDCATAVGDYVDFGELSSTKSDTGQTQLLVATNGDNGYNVILSGQTLTSGNNVIPPLGTPDVSRTGVSQFGLNLRANNTPPSGHDVQGAGNGTITGGYNTPDFYKFNSGDIIAGSPLPDDYRLYTANYVVNVASSQPAGVYVTTITYICLANF